LTKEELIEHLDNSRWKFAKTMPHNPHFYTLRKTWSNQRKFDEAVSAIRRYGVREKCKGYWYTVFYTKDFKYWTMGAPINKTILINRKSAYDN